MGLDVDDSRARYGDLEQSVSDEKRARADRGPASDDDASSAGYNARRCDDRGNAAEFGERADLGGVAGELWRRNGFGTGNSGSEFGQDSSVVASYTAPASS